MNVAPTSQPQPLSPEHLDIASRPNGYGGAALACLDDHAIFVEAEGHGIRQPRNRCRPIAAD